MLNSLSLSLSLCGWKMEMLFLYKASFKAVPSMCCFRKSTFNLDLSLFFFLQQAPGSSNMVSTEAARMTVGVLGGLLSLINF
jgi:hypothetical protein